jgi:hypothetical protein
MELEPAKFTAFHLAISDESSPKLISEYDFLVDYWSKSTNLILIPTWNQSDLSQSLLDIPIYKFVDFSMVFLPNEIRSDYNDRWTNHN